MWCCVGVKKRARGTLKRLVPISEVLRLGKKPAKSIIIYSYKKDVFHQGGPNGPKGERAKARYIICGYSLRPGVDYNKTASPSADMTVWRMLVSLQVMINRSELVNWQFDVPTAYLWANKRTHRVFMHQAEGYEEPGSEGKCWELGTFLYGEPPAGLGWYLELVEALESAGFSKNPACPSLFVKIERKEAASGAEWYDSDVNAHRRIHMRAPTGGECSIMGRDFFATLHTYSCKSMIGRLSGIVRSTWPNSRLSSRNSRRSGTRPSRTLSARRRKRSGAGS